MASSLSGGAIASIACKGSGTTVELWLPYRRLTGRAGRAGHPYLVETEPLLPGAGGR